MIDPFHFEIQRPSRVESQPSLFLIRETVTWEIADHIIIDRCFIFNMAVAQEALKICESLEGILKKTFGPNGLDVMLNSSSGNILITNNGALILKSLSVDNHIGRTVVDGVVSLSSITGDGSTSFILLLTALLRETMQCTGISGRSSIAEMSSNQRQSLLALSRAFIQFESTLIDEVVVPCLRTITITTDLQDEDLSMIKQKINRLIYSTLNGKFPVNTVLLFAEILSDLITKTWKSPVLSLRESVLHVIDEFPQICIEVPSLPISFSQVKQGILIPRQFAFDVEEIFTTLQNFKFVVLNCSLDVSEPQVPSSIRINDQSSFDMNFQWKRNQVQRLITMFQQHGIRLILSSENVSDLVLHFCRQTGIAVVSMIPVECTEYICKCTGVLPVHNIDSNNLDEVFLGTSLSCGTQRLGHHKFVCMHVDPCNLQFSPHYLILCSPVQGLCKQYYIALHNALKSVKMSFSEDGNCLTFLPGCGAAEFAMSFSLKLHSLNVVDPNMSQALEILSKALQTIPHTLHQNSFSILHEKENFMHCLHEVEKSWKNNGIVLGVDSKTGKAVDAGKLELYEPFSGKYLLIQSVLQCLSQLLRTEKFLGVKKL